MLTHDYGNALALALITVLFLHQAMHEAMCTLAFS